MKMSFRLRLIRLRSSSQYEPKYFMISLFAWGATFMYLSMRSKDDLDVT